MDNLILGEKNYKAGIGYQPIHLIRETGMNFNVGNVVKYVYRYKRKNGLEDLEKAKTYLEWVFEDSEKKVVPAWVGTVSSEDSKFMSYDNEIDDLQFRFYSNFFTYLHFHYGKNEYEDGQMLKDEIRRSLDNIINSIKK